MKVTWVTMAAPVQREDGTLTSDLASLRYRVLSPIFALPPTYGHQIAPLSSDSAPAAREAALNADVIVFSKSFDAANEQLAEQARARGVAVVVDVCDHHYDHPVHGPHYRRLTALADQVVCSTDAMRDVARAYASAPPVVIQDPYEGTRQPPRFAPGERLRLLWFGHPSNLDSLQVAVNDLGAYAARRPVDLHLLTSPVDGLAQFCAGLNQRFGPGLKVTSEAWSQAALVRALADCDAVVIPTLRVAQKAVKSANRLVDALWAGRPVVAQPMPAYQPFAAWTPIRPQLSEGLAALEADPAGWTARIAAAQDYIAATHSPAALGQLWDRVLKTVKSRPVGQPPAAAAAAATPAADGRVRLNLGCGDKILPGYVNVDVVESRAGKRPDVICDLHQLTPFEDASADEVMAIHVVEHFWRWEVVDILKEWVRVLKPGGRMILECPNLIAACEAVLANPELASQPGPEGQRSMWVLYGDPRWHDPLMVHRWAYTPKSLAEVMAQAGLTDIRQEPAQYKLREPRDMRVTGVKPG